MEVAIKSNWNYDETYCKTYWVGCFINVYLYFFKQHSILLPNRNFLINKLIMYPALNEGIYFWSQNMIKLLTISQLYQTSNFNHKELGILIYKVMFIVLSFTKHSRCLLPVNSVQRSNSFLYPYLTKEHFVRQ